VWCSGTGPMSGSVGGHPRWHAVPAIVTQCGREGGRTVSAHQSYLSKAGGGGYDRVGKRVATRRNEHCTFTFAFGAGAGGAVKLGICACLLASVCV
jgi:hypothetical protein